MNEQGSNYSERHQVALVHSQQENDSRLDRVVESGGKSNLQGHEDEGMEISKEDDEQVGSNSVGKRPRQHGATLSKKKQKQVNSDSSSSSSDGKSLTAERRTQKEAGTDYSGTRTEKGGGDTATSDTPAESKADKKNEPEEEKEEATGKEDTGEEEKGEFKDDDSKLYYTDNITAACAATNDELTPNWSEEDSGQPPRRSKGVSGLAGSTGARGRKAGGRSRGRKAPSQEASSVEGPDAVDGSAPLLVQRLRQENRDLTQEIVMLKQRVERLSNLLEMAIGTSTQETDGVPPTLGIPSSFQQPSLLQRIGLGGTSYGANVAGLGGGNASALLGGLQPANDIASLLARQYQQQDQQRLATLAAASLARSDSNKLPTSFGNTASLLRASGGEQHSSILAQLLGSPSQPPSSSSSSPFFTTGATAQRGTPSELQRYLAESRVQGRRGISTATFAPVMGTVAGVPNDASLAKGPDVGKKKETDKKKSS